MQAIDIRCIFEYFTYMDNKTIYVCKIVNQIVPNCKLNFVGKHIIGRSHYHVQEVIFNSCCLQHIPKGLTKLFPHIEDLSILGSEIKQINKEDLAEYKSLKRLNVLKSEIEYLPGDLFEGFQNLEEISFEGDILKIVEPNILDGHDNLLNVDFRDGHKYKKSYTIYPDYYGNASLEEVKDELNQVYKSYMDNMQKYLKLERPKEPETSISSCLINHIKDERFKDFKILIGDREFHVHKFVLAARSPTLAEILLNNPEVENLKLLDIPEEIFVPILNYMYTDELPNFEELDVLRFYAAAGRLQIDVLKNFAASHYLDKINSQNALDVLKISNKYEHAELKNKAFEKIKNDYPKITFKEGWANKAGFVEKVIEKFVKKEKVLRIIEEKFKNELLDSD